MPSLLVPLVNSQDDGDYVTLTFPHERRLKGGVSITDTTQIVDQINHAATCGQIKKIESFINSMALEEQLGLHGLLNPAAIETIANNIDILNIDRGVKEHIIWYYLSKLNWSDEVLSRIIKIYKHENYIALESLVISAIKLDEVEDYQIEMILNVFDTKEIKREIEKRIERRKNSNRLNQ